MSRALFFEGFYASITNIAGGGDVEYIYIEAREMCVILSIGHALSRGSWLYGFNATAKQILCGILTACDKYTIMFCSVSEKIILL